MSTLMYGESINTVSEISFDQVYANWNWELREKRVLNEDCNAL